MTGVLVRREETPGWERGTVNKGRPHSRLPTAYPFCMSLVLPSLVMLVREDPRAGKPSSVSALSLCCIIFLGRPRAETVWFVAQVGGSCVISINYPVPLQVGKCAATLMHQTMVLPPALSM